MLTGALLCAFVLMMMCGIVGSAIDPAEWMSPGEEFVLDVLLPIGFITMIALAAALINFVLAWGVWNGKELTYVFTFIVAGLWCLTIVGILVSVPIIVFLLQPEAKRYFGKAG